MQTSYFLSITRSVVLLLPLILGIGCTSSGDEKYDDILNGTIAFPFAAEPTSLGKEPVSEKLVIRSAVGNREYTIEIPNGAKEYDVQIPVAELDKSMGTGVTPGKPGNPATTDRELISALPSLDKARPTDTALMDAAMGVGRKEGPIQAPSYSMGISKINQLYKDRRYEFALIEINQLLTFYPNSPKLLKMKGTILVKTRNFALAEQAWIKALELAPRDKSLRRGIKLLQNRILAEGGVVDQSGLGQDLSIPKAVGMPATIDTTGH